MKRKKKKSWGIIRSVVIAIILAIIIRQFLFNHIVVYGTSMLPTLHDHNHVVINKLSYKISEPRRFDIIVFHADRKQDYIKRVIGLPGETVEYKDDQLYIDGKKVKEPFLKKIKHPDQGLFTYDFKEKVPEGTVFVLGDNRRESQDSREIGPIPLNQVIGKAMFVFWPVTEVKHLP
ncbi:signal peptidase I [Pullulanibacillus pueri]|uniref:Signal peptidase I n=1 Tax=Pullulanibacillus pueri TaxID=1437324 RepID=A0A8J2ZSL0_9BACL|nr:signal peptidase I [Pullulanibacillus pueri]MBM7680212.1 signal peptidase I [Pullulanibacillus pueri]GGH74916.1 signal peptidase I [Pullulanibacillus pueri]